MGLSRTVSEISGDFRQKSHNFPNSLCFAPPLKVFPLELGIGAWGQKLVTGLSGRERSLTISSAVWIQYTNVNVTERQTDGRTDNGRQQRPRLRLASRGKNWHRGSPRPT